ncbi:DUF3126 family protein [Aureimonas glaciei]|uniref:DUF3126 domain-containing protein n=1 Tax=Aureimonas glaciei TaxID=1776957 RepID=A0A916XXH9_9HYPH|nr:DUF3126 family protein [Aureimonas glaciei]GGD18827.1 hypothetical protein GCM10011335_22150 [Aureimonas glaciei]
MKPDEIRKLETYLKGLLGSANIRIKALPRKADSAEVYINDEFIGIISKDTDEGELSYHVTMTILEMDLEA